MKYKLINKQTGEEHNCTKVGEYYVSDSQKVNINDNYVGYDGRLLIWNKDLVELVESHNKMFNEESNNIPYKVIATTNPFVSLPKVIEDVEILASLYSLTIPAQMNEEEVEYASNGYYNGYKKSQETNPFNLQDMVDFAEWIADKKKHGYTKQLYEAMIVNKVSTTEELIQIWQTQQTKTIYFQ